MWPAELDELALIGPIIAAMVALFIAFLPSLRKWYNRPRLKLEFDNREPFCRHAMLLEPIKIGGKEYRPTENAYWIRLRVVNKGRSVARGCEGKLVRIVDPESGNEYADFDPVILHWAGYAIGSIDINKSEYEYLDVVFTRANSPGKWFVNSIEEQPRGIRLDWPAGNYLLDITLYGRNFSPLSIRFRLVASHEYDKIKLHRVEH
ncbi:MAG: hypothetical protein H3Z52_03655 [archaeon]|nr:hypothetical protein [archaeon]MCP8320026.1 hypothetical protein [archaeon]